MSEQYRPLTDGSFRLNVATTADEFRTMQGAWQLLGQGSEVPAAQPEWTLAAAGGRGGAAIRVIYAADAGGVQAVLPLVEPSGGANEPWTMPGPASEMPMDVAFHSAGALQACFRYALGMGRPIVLRNLLADSPVLAVISEMTGEDAAELTTPIRSLPIRGMELPDRSQSAARASIMAASFGFSCGPADVLFQHVAPTAQQVVWLVGEVLDIDKGGRRTADEDGEDDEFWRQHAVECARAGEMRFSCMRMGGRLLAGQIIQCRGTTAWVLKMKHLECFRSGAMDALLMQETIRELQKDEIGRIVVPRVEGLPELGAMGEVSRVCATLRPARSLGRIFSRAGKALFGRAGIL